MKKMTIGFGIASGLIAITAGFCTVRGYQMGQASDNTRTALINTCVEGFSKEGPDANSSGPVVNAVARGAVCLSAAGAAISTPQP